MGVKLTQSRVDVQDVRVSDLLPMYRPENGDVLISIVCVCCEMCLCLCLSIRSSHQLYFGKMTTSWAGRSVLGCLALLVVNF